MDIVIRSLYCLKCSLQFDLKYVFDVHLSIVHGGKLDIKEEPDSQLLVIHEAKELEIENQQDKENTLKNESKRMKMSLKTASGHKGKKQFKCDICYISFGLRGHLNKHVSTVHEGKKPFKCKIFDVQFEVKHKLNEHIASVHEERNHFKCCFCKAMFEQMPDLNKHIASVHEGSFEHFLKSCPVRFSPKIVSREDF